MEGCVEPQHSRVARLWLGFVSIGLAAQDAAKADVGSSLAHLQAGAVPQGPVGIAPFHDSLIGTRGNFRTGPVAALRRGQGCGFGVILWRVLIRAPLPRVAGDIEQTEATAVVLERPDIVDLVGRTRSLPKGSAITPRSTPRIRTTSG